MKKWDFEKNLWVKDSSVLNIFIIGLSAYQSCGKIRQGEKIFSKISYFGLFKVILVQKLTKKCNFLFFLNKNYLCGITAYGDKWVISEGKFLISDYVN